MRTRLVLIIAVAAGLFAPSLPAASSGADPLRDRDRQTAQRQAATGHGCNFAPRARCGHIRVPLDRAKPDGRDMSVSDAPFNWDAQLDSRKLRIGIIQDSFDSLSNDDAKRNAQELLNVLRKLGMPAPAPVHVPLFNTNVAALGWWTSAPRARRSASRRPGDGC